MNYEDVEPHLESCYIISSDEQKNLIKEVPKDQKLYVIEKVIKGTEVTFKNFLKALEESQDDCNHKLMIHLQQALHDEAQSMPLCHSEMLNTPSNSTPTQSTASHSKTEPSPSISTASSRDDMPNQCMTEQEEPLSAASANFQALQLPMNGTLDLQDDNWVIVNPETNITYSKNLALVMEYIYDELKESLSETSCVQLIDNRSTPIKLVKEVYLAADPETATHTTRAADEQIQQSYELLLKSLCKLQCFNYPVISIDLKPILEKIDYSPNKSTLRKCSIEGLIEAVEKLNHPSEKTSHCLII